ncbi:MAG: alcohol dehydrogenase catalytic domain-containing protein [Acidimicrobiales bacterium]|nr:alcohol dehydrogenase catalytic domain-containing protein [Acidimicrobiales bacterium]
MELVRVHGPGDARLDEVAEPEPGPADVVIDVAACGVCGSDLTYIKQGGLMGPGPEPMPLGHEFSGTVSFAGSAVTGVTVGDRVVANPGNNDVSHIGNGGTEGAFTRRLLVRNAAAGGRIFAIPDHLSFEVAALTEPVGVGMHAAAQADITAGDQVVVFGAGPIGLAAIGAAVDAGASDVVAIDLSPERLAIAEQIGAHATLAADDDVWASIRDRHGLTKTVFGPMAATDAFVECTGAPPVIPAIIANAGTRARISVAGLHFQDVPTSFLTILTKELTIRGAMEYPDRFEDAIELIDRHDMAPMITHRIPLERWSDVNELIAGPRSFGKIMVTMT